MVPLPANITICFFAYRSQPNKVLTEWLKRREREGYKVVRAEDANPVDLARNMAVQRFLAEDLKAKHLLMVDADAVPLVGHFERLLTEPGDVLYAGHLGSGGLAGHMGNKNFGCHMSRLSRHVLEAVPPPWFKITTNDAGTKHRHCECDWFRDAAAARGFESHQVGIAGHVQEMIIVPTDKGSFAYSPITSMLPPMPVVTDKAPGTL
jgi:hypothetical protein